MGFQIIFTLVISIAIIKLCVQFYKRHINSFYFIFFLAIWAISIFFAWNVDFLNKIGHLLGIERGATMLVYFGLFFLFYHAFIININFYKIEREINKLIKKDAIENFLKTIKNNKK